MNIPFFKMKNIPHSGMRENRFVHVLFEGGYTRSR